MKRRAATAGFESPVIATIIPQPQDEKPRADQSAVDHGCSREFKHAALLKQNAPKANFGAL
jgi:hypothetical protein